MVKTPNAQSIVQDKTHEMLPSDIYQNDGIVTKDSINAIREES
jgi:hypothetical protein